MSKPVTDNRVFLFLGKDRLGDLIDKLKETGYLPVGPVVRDDVVVLRPIQSREDLSQGVLDQQSPGRYRLGRGSETAWFDFVVGPDSAKRFLFPMELKLMKLHAEKNRFVLDESSPQPPKYAFFGLRPCDLAAVRVQDRVFGYDDPGTFRCESEPYYNQMRRQACFIIVNCTQPGGNCFCHSMGTGPRVREGFDLALTEIRSGFLVEVGSETGAGLLEGLSLREATSAELELVDLKLQRAVEKMGKSMDTRNLPALLDQNIDHPRWDDVAKRCLSCGNCTMVCPTCFCSTVTDTTDLSGKNVTRTRRWESCYTHQFSYTTSGPHRHTIRGRYRHWLRHKLGTWHEQFGTSGCVGCGRCITWCPVGIDLTEEVAAIRANDPTESVGKPMQHTNEVKP